MEVVLLFFWTYGIVAVSCKMYIESQDLLCALNK
jgi:hypothetical protein